MTDIRAARLHHRLSELFGKGEKKRFDPAERKRAVDDIFPEIVQVYRHMVASYLCSRLPGQPAAVADVFQDTSLSLFRGLLLETFRYEGPPAFRGWVNTLARKRWYDWCDKEKRIGRDVAAIRAEGCLQEPIAVDSERRLQVNEAVNACFPVLTKEEIHLLISRLAGVSYKDVSEQTGLLERTLITQASRARKKMRKERKRLLGSVPKQVAGVSTVPVGNGRRDGDGEK